MDWSALVPLVAGAAPTIGSLLGGLIPFPGGAILGEVAGKVLAEALGVAPTPDAINTAITTGDPTVVQAQLTEAETKMNAEVEKHKADLADVADARSTNLELAKAGSKISYAPAIVSAIVLFGFAILSFIAMKPEITGVRTDVTLFLLGAWSGYAGAVVTYWLGSSAGSTDKSAQIERMVASAAAGKPVIIPPPIKKK